MRWILVAVLFALMSLAATSPAGAQTYPGCVAELSDVTVAPGDSFTVTGINAQPGDEVTASIEGQRIGSGTADSNGDFSFSANLPANLSRGTHSAEVSCGPLGADLTSTITAAGPSGAAPSGGSPAGALPRTGAGNPIGLTQIAIGLIAAGGLVALTSKRRRAAEPGIVSA